MSLLNLYRAARNPDEKNTLKCFKFFILILFGVVFGFLIATALASIVLGVLFKNNCPLQPKIPIFLIVMGCAIVIRNVFAMGKLYKKGNDDEAPGYRCVVIRLLQVIDLFTFAWFITGSCWVFAIYPPVYDDQQELYCNKILYLFSFSALLIPYCILFVVFTMGCILLIFKRQDSTETLPSHSINLSPVNSDTQTTKSLL